MISSWFRKLRQQENWIPRVILVIVCSALLLFVFLNQKFNYLHFMSCSLGLDYEYSKFFIFSFNKVARFLINDLLTILMIWGIFYERKYVVIAIIVQFFGMFILLPTYLYIKSHYPGYNGPLISWLHRFTLNPLLLMLLIPAFLYQRSIKQ